MLMTNDGKKFVYAVFSADGYECESLEGIFEDEASANEFKQERAADPYVYGNPNFLSVECIQLGISRVPAPESTDEEKAK